MSDHVTNSQTGEFWKETWKNGNWEQLAIPAHEASPTGWLYWNLQVIRPDSWSHLEYQLPNFILSFSDRRPSCLMPISTTWVNPYSPFWLLWRIHPQVHKLSHTLSSWTVCCWCRVSSVRNSTAYPLSLLSYLASPKDHPSGESGTRQRCPLGIIFHLCGCTSGSQASGSWLYPAVSCSSIGSLCPVIVSCHCVLPPQPEFCTPALLMDMGKEEEMIHSINYLCPMLLKHTFSSDRCQPTIKHMFGEGGEKTKTESSKILGFNWFMLLYQS